MVKRLLSLLLVLVSTASLVVAENDTLRTPPTGPRNDVKVTLLSIFSGSTRVTYERVLGARTSAELTVGAVGLGYDWLNGADPSGIVVKAAYKWNLQEERCAYTPLAGFYVKPELIYASYDYDNEDLPQVDGGPARDHTTRWALLAEGGWQHIWNNWFLFDIYAGLGPSWGDVNQDNYYHGVMLFPRDSHLAFTAGFRLGVAF